MLTKLASGNEYKGRPGDTARLQEVKMELALGRAPTAAEQTQMQGMIAERERLVRTTAKGGSSADRVKYAQLDEQINMGRPYNAAETTKQALVTEQKVLTKIASGNEGKSRPGDAARLQEVKMELALGRAPTATERTQMQGMITERDRLQKSVAKGGRGPDSADVAKLNAVNAEIAKRNSAATSSNKPEAPAKPVIVIPQAFAKPATAAAKPATAVAAKPPADQKAAAPKSVVTPQSAKLIAASKSLSAAPKPAVAASATVTTLKLVAKPTVIPKPAVPSARRSRRAQGLCP